MIGDGDTGFGSAQNIKRTVQGYARGRVCLRSCSRIRSRRNDAATPKARRSSVATRRSCGSAPRWTRADAGADILIMARTDARACVEPRGGDRALPAFREIGADITFLEAPLDEDEMRRYCQRSRRPEDGQPDRGRQDADAAARTQLEAIGYKIAVYPLTLLNVSIHAMRDALRSLKAVNGHRPPWTSSS